MVWPPRSSVCRIQFEVTQQSTPHRFLVEIPHRDGVAALRSQDRILLALKGVEVGMQKESNAPFSFPIVLRFPNSVVFKYTAGINSGSTHQPPL